MSDDETEALSAEAMIVALADMAESQQKAVSEVLDQMQEQHKALKGVTALAATMVRDADVAAKRTAGVIQASAQASAQEGTAVLLETLSLQAVGSLMAAAQPALARLEGTARAAGETESRLNAATRSVTWKWVALSGAAMAGACLVALASVWWQQHELSGLREDRARAQADLAQLTRNLRELEVKGARIRLNTCDGRLCVEIAPNQGGNVRVEGAWQGRDGRQYVVPKGY